MSSYFYIHRKTIELLPSIVFTSVGKIKTIGFSWIVFTFEIVIKED